MCVCVMCVVCVCVCVCVCCSIAGHNSHTVFFWLSAWSIKGVLPALITSNATKKRVQYLVNTHTPIHKRRKKEREREREREREDNQNVVLHQVVFSQCRVADGGGNTPQEENQTPFSKRTHSLFSIPLYSISLSLSLSLSLSHTHTHFAYLLFPATGCFLLKFSFSLFSPLSLIFPPPFSMIKIQLCGPHAQKAAHLLARPTPENKKKN